MWRSDYIMRAIQQLVSVLPHIRQLVVARRESDALDVIEQTLRQILDVPPDEANFSLRDATSYLRFDDLSSQGRQQRLAAAALLREAGTVHLQQQRPDAAYPCLLQALHLVIEVIQAAPSETLSSYAPTVDELDTELRAYTLPAETYRRLLHTYERQGAYAKGEDILHVWRDSWPDDSQVHNEGRAFYYGLQQRTDPELAVGNLPRDEVNEGLAAWHDSAPA